MVPSEENQLVPKEVSEAAGPRAGREAAPAASGGPGAGGEARPGPARKGPGREGRGRRARWQPGGGSCGPGQPRLVFAAG